MFKNCIENDFGKYGYEFSEEFDCYVCYEWNNGWNAIASFELEDDARELCEK